METLNLKLSPRTITGKKVRMLRREGIIPVHLFGKGSPSQALQINVGALRKVLPQAGTNVPIMVEVEGEKGGDTCFIREVQRHPITSEFLHVDFLSVDVSQVITVEVPVILDGNAPAVENMGGILLQIVQTLPVKALPLEVPVSFRLDVSILDDFEKSLRVSDIAVANNVSILRAVEEMIARVVPPRIEEEEVESEEDEMDPDAESTEDSDEATEESAESSSESQETQS